MYYFCYYLWRHNGEQFSSRSSLSLRLTRLKVPIVARASYVSVSLGQLTQYTLRHGQVQRVLCQPKANCWALGSTHGLVSLTPPCAFYVPTRRATLPGLHSSTLYLMTSASAPADSATTVLLSGHRKGFITFRRGGIANGRCRLPTFSFVSSG